LSIFYSFVHQFKNGITKLQGVNLRFLRSRESHNNATWISPSNSIITKNTDVNGTYNGVNLLDTYREGISVTAIERFNWTLKARKYDKKTAGENVFTNRILYQGTTNMSAGYSEEVQMIDVSYLTLTEAQALALTGISFAPSGATGATVTISSARTVAELWQYYRAWISQIANFDSNDTWGYDATTLNIGDWTIIGIEFLTGGAVTTTSATASASFTNLTINGNVAQATPTNLTGTTKVSQELAYSINTDITITYGDDVEVYKVVNNGTGIVTISGGKITDYSDPQINYLDSSLSFLGINSITAYPTQLDRDDNTNAGFTKTISPFNFKFGSVLSGVTMSGTMYFRATIGTIVQLGETTITQGDNSISLTDNSLLQGIQGNLQKINRNVIKSSKFKIASEQI
jgi:hypothetical protein